MSYLGDYFALGLVAILFMFFFDSKISVRYMPVSSKLFLACLISTAVNAATDLLTGYLLTRTGTPLWLNMLANSAYFMFNIVTTSLIALYLFTKLLEHTHSRHCMKRACIGLAALFGIYTVVVIANLFTGWLFYFDASGAYCRGPINVLGYIITLMQMVLVCICYIRNREVASSAVRRALIQVFPVIPLCIVIQRIHPEIMLNSILIAFADTVLFMTFQGQREGVHSLTKLNDRHRFFKEIDRRIAKKEPFHVFLINIKNFGAINQRYGHLFGDELLYQFAFSIEKLLKGSMSFHMNGTVFAIVMPYTYQITAEKQCGELLDFLERGIHLLDKTIDIDYFVSHYVAEGQEENASSLYETMEYAITKAYDMKHRYIPCSREDSSEVARKHYLRDKLQVIDKLHGFEVWFQPVKCLATGRFSSMEALIRLRENDGTLISPVEFIPLAEQTGCISSVTWFVLEEVCRVLKYSSELEGVSVSINMPMAQLLEKGFLPRFTGIVDQAGIEHRRICIEFTERAMTENFQQTLAVMEKMTQDGFRFYLDDFGAGLSNFNRLLQLPFQVIKLDTCLVHAGKDGQPDYTMVSTLTRLFRDMNLTIVAEGAETEEDVQNLTEAGVDRIQGFALARPMPSNQLITFYKEHPAAFRSNPFIIIS